MADGNYKLYKENIAYIYKSLGNGIIIKGNWITWMYVSNKNKR